MMRRLLNGLAGLLAAGALVASAYAQGRLIPIPAKAKRADITFESTSRAVLIEGKAVPMAPGLRIYNQNNLLVMSGSLNGVATAKYLLEETTGSVIGIWLLTQDEIARPEPAENK